jgi:hypothetical protein
MEIWTSIKRGTMSPPLYCRLHESLGRHESCPGIACPLWGPGDATHEARCALADLDLTGRPEAAAWLLRIRTELETARTPEENRVSPAASG